VLANKSASYEVTRRASEACDQLLLKLVGVNKKIPQVSQNPGSTSGQGLLLLGSVSSFRSAAEKLAEAIFEPKKILHTRRSKCVRRARRDSAEAFFRGKNRWEPIFLLQI
ncbi:MAG: hypothetical protein IJJ66_03210, partial [Treponema sp.]|nr:hypothetical protein [Treponema sp.]